MDINQTYCSDRFIAYMNVDSLCCTPETNTSVISQLKSKLA